MTNLYKIVFILVIGICGDAYAQQAAMPSAKPAKKGRIELRFDNELVEGAIETPDLEMIKNKYPTRFKKLLKFREGFSHEAQKGAAQFEQNP